MNTPSIPSSDTPSEQTAALPEIPAVDATEVKDLSQLRGLVRTPIDRKRLGELGKKIAADMDVPSEQTIEELFYNALGDACESENMQELIALIKKREDEMAKSCPICHGNHTAAKCPSK